MTDKPTIAQYPTPEDEPHTPHTPAPWQYFAGLSYKPVQDQHGETRVVTLAKAERNPEIVAGVISPAERDANIRRVVFCVNFCEGVPNEQLRAYGSLQAVVNKHQLYVEGQDDMLAAEKEAVEALKLGDLTVKEWVERARALMDEAADILRSYYPERDPREVQNEIEHVYGHMEALL